MTMFDAEVSVLKPTIGVPSEEALQAGAEPEIEIGVVTGLALPFANPATGEPLAVPTGRLRFNLSRELAITFFTEGLEAAQKLPEKTAASGKLLVASNMAEVDRAAQNIKRATGQ